MCRYSVRNSAINFTSSKLRNDGTTRTTVTATVSDAQGLATISWVRLKSLVDGLETPEWMTGYEPLAYDNSNLYDNGTHGDRVAGDGIYTNNTIRTNPTCNFYPRRWESVSSPGTRTTTTSWPTRPSLWSTA